MVTTGTKWTLYVLSLWNFGVLFPRLKREAAKQSPFVVRDYKSNERQKIKSSRRHFFSKSPKDNQNERYNRKIKAVISNLPFVIRELSFCRHCVFASLLKSRGVRFMAAQPRNQFLYTLTPKSCQEIKSQ